MDVWRISHPTDKDYSFYSATRNSYSRIDFSLVSHFALTFKPQSSISNILWSDHAPVYLPLSLPNLSKRQWAWRLNDSLLQNELCSTEIRQAIANFISDHRTDDTSAPIQWAALKCVVRGMLIKHRSRLKKDRLAQIVDLSTCISNLEKSHKLSQSPATMLALSNARL